MTAVQYLDLSAHDRDDYEGKLVTCNGCTYVVGQVLGIGAERVVHTLINRQSTLSLLVIKVLKQPRPRGLYTRTIAHLRTDLTLSRAIPITIEVEVPGGMVELQRTVGRPVEEDAAIEEVIAGFAALEGSAPAPEVARQRFIAALAINPRHTDALYGLSETLWRLERPFDALERIEEAVQIEPNLLHYRRTHIQLAHVTQQLGLARVLFHQTEHDFPDVHDLDEVGVELLLNAGDPAEALKLVPTMMVTDERREEMRREAEHAAHARQQAIALMVEAHGLVMARQWEAASELLQSAQRIYNRDPMLCMNTAFTAIHAGEPRLAAGLMVHASKVVTGYLAAACSANAGFALLLTEDLDDALSILGLAALRLTTMYGAIPNSPEDLPGVGIWIEDESLHEERIGVAADLLEQGLDRAGAAGMAVSDDVRALVAAYRVAAAAPE